MSKENFLNEFRQDLVSGDWVLYSTQRSRRPQEHKYADSYQPKEGCPFEDPKASGQEIIEFYPSLAGQAEDDWFAASLKNKYPGVKQGICSPGFQNGPFEIHGAIGSHEVIVYKDHEKHFADFSQAEAVNAIRFYKKRYQSISEGENKDCTRYIMIFHNFGKEAGASIYHPHSQVISTPILPPDVASSISGSYDFYEKNKKRVYDVIIDWEKEQKKRIVYENDLFIAFCPFVSKIPYEVRIFLRDSHAHFEKMPDEFDKYLADALISVLKKIKGALNNPPYNFFIHTAPFENGLANPAHEYYSWHIEILPKLSISAGFELGTGVDINIVDPDMAAEELRNTK